jgi:hypothetical protein
VKEAKKKSFKWKNNTWRRLWILYSVDTQRERYIYIYIEREREREREIDSDPQRQNRNKLQ